MQELHVRKDIVKGKYKPVLWTEIKQTSRQGLIRKREKVGLARLWASSVRKRAGGRGYRRSEAKEPLKLVNVWNNLTGF